MPTRLFAIAAVVTCLVAFAGTRAKESAAQAPTATTDGVSLSEVTGCRASVRVDAGTLATGGKILISYYDPVLGWVQSDSSLHCTVAATSDDGGTRTSYVCPDMQPLAQYGRIAAQSTGVTSSGGAAVKTRIECFGATLP